MLELETKNGPEGHKMLRLENVRRPKVKFPQLVYTLSGLIVLV